MSNLPHFLTDPVDPTGQEFRADCMAWELFTKKPRAEREAVNQRCKPRSSAPACAAVRRGGY